MKKKQVKMKKNQVKMKKNQMKMIQINQIQKKQKVPEKKRQIL